MEQIRENTLSPPYVLEFVQSNNLLLRSHTPVSFENLQRKQNTTVETTKKHVYIASESRYGSEQKMTLFL